MIMYEYLADGAKFNVDWVTFHWEISSSISQFECIVAVTPWPQQPLTAVCPVQHRVINVVVVTLKTTQTIL